MTLTVIGAGNIGSHLLALLARLPGVHRITIVDRDVYDLTNLATQDITRADLGKPKARVQARRLRRLGPKPVVVDVCDAVENVPLGLLRADMLVACLDSRGARRVVNELAWHLGVAWIDAGVRREDLLARVNVYQPGPDQPCFECPWEDRDYAVPERPNPCDEEAPAARPTNAPAALGALAASLQALEITKWFAGPRAEVAVGRQVTVSALTHQLQVTRFARNPDCRFDHAIWSMIRLDRRPGQFTLARVFARGRDAIGAGGALRMRVPQQQFAQALVCVGCGARRDLGLRLFGRVGAGERTCPTCGQRMRAAGTDLHEWLVEDEMPAAVQDVPLARLGIRRGDVLTVEAGAERAVHFQLGGSVR